MSASEVYAMVQRGEMSPEEFEQWFSTETDNAFNNGVDAANYANSMSTLSS